MLDAQVARLHLDIWTHISTIIIIIAIIIL